MSRTGHGSGFVTSGENKKKKTTKHGQHKPMYKWPEKIRIRIRVEPDIIDHMDSLCKRKGWYTDRKQQKSDYNRLLKFLLRDEPKAKHGTRGRQSSLNSTNEHLSVTIDNENEKNESELLCIMFNYAWFDDSFECI